MGKLLQIATFLVLLSAPAGAAEPKIVTSFPMLQSLAAAVSGAAPESIVRGGGSPHTYSMRPSDARALEQADLVIWIGEDYEGFLERPIKALGKRARVLELAEAPGVATFKAREGGVWEGDGHAHGHKHGNKHGEIDGHMFLDPKNAAAFGRAIAAALSEIDAPNAARYRANAEALATKLDALDAELATSLRPLAGKPFIVFHDSLQYLEKRYGLTPAGSITVSPERRPSAQRLQRLRDRIARSKTICVFAEPQFDQALVRTVAEGTKAKTGTLDYVGAEVPPGPDHYFSVMRGLAKDLSSCLSQG
ncbi:MAG: zinc ABC transporter substrate-binding protein [Alphaproteobacteria bacterium]|nr:zinc ABC transporter substrate-binding protein [Alphaproteobacteria bacterium]